MKPLEEFICETGSRMYLGHVSIPVLRTALMAYGTS